MGKDEEKMNIEYPTRLWRVGCSSFNMFDVNISKQLSAYALHPLSQDGHLIKTISSPATGED